MNSTTFLWRTFGTAALLSTLLLLFGLGYAINDIIFPKPGEFAATTIQQPLDTITNKDQIQIFAMGDSLTKGTGDETGKGYVNSFAEKLKSAIEKPVFVLNNIAVNGYTSAQLLEDLETKPTLMETMKAADIITFTIGGNDLFSAAQEEFSPEQSRARIAGALPNVEKIIDKLSTSHPQAQIYYLALYHPFLDLDPTREGSVVVADWNHEVFLIANRYPNVTVVPTYDLFQLQLLNYLSSDHFHPNREGYERMADRLLQIIL